MNAELLLQHFDRISDAPDAVVRIRGFIRNLAILGQLTTQVPGDGTGASLLRLARELKSELMVQRHITRDQVFEECHFSRPTLPESWAWASIYDVALVQGGKRLPLGATFSKAPTEHIYIRVTDMKNGTINPADIRYIDPAVQRQIAQYTIEKDDLYLTIAGTIGQVGRVPPHFHGQNLTENAAKIVFRGFNADYFCLALNSEIVQAQFRDQTNQLAQPKLALKRVLGAKFPLPPLAEQHRIVAKVDELMALCDRLEEARKEREARRDRLTAASLHHLNNAAPGEDLRKHASFFIKHLPKFTVRPDQIGQLRQFILDLAVRGRLIPQESSDEPASKLLQRIQRQRASLVSDGSIRSGPPPLAESPDVADLPVGWVSVPLGSIIHLVSGQHLQPSEYSESTSGELPYITGPSDFGSTGLNITRHAHVRKAVASLGQLLVTVKGSGVGKSMICNLPEVAISRQLMAMTAIAWSDKYLAIITHLLAENLRTRARSLIPGISREDINAFIIGLPPLAEQHRIVAKVHELMALFDRLDGLHEECGDFRRKCLSAVLADSVHVEVGL